MWESLVRVPQGSNNLRKFSRVLATFFVACFAYIFATTPTTYAADTTWSGDSIVYQDRTYTSVPSSDDFPSDVKGSPAIYQHVDDTRTPNLIYFIFFKNGVTEPKSEKEATYVRYTLNPPNSYINPTGKKTVSMEPVNPEEPAEGDGFLTGNCTIPGIGYIICPAMNGIAEGMDLVYELIRGFLVVQPMTTDVNNPIYRIWIVMRDIANIAFVIGFLVIIYSYLVGGDFKGYEIRKILPRIVVAATLINLSYVICAVAVDVSNIAGYSVNQLFETVRDTTLSGSDTGASLGDVNWVSVTSWVLAGGGAAAAGLTLLPGVTGGTTIAAAASGLWMLLMPFLFGGALVVMVTFIILAARQAIIFILIAIAPLAFAAYILPNTEKWFEKWRSLFFTMLIMFPAFGAVFGASQLAGEAIIRMAKQTGSIEQIILGLGVMFAPLAITPLLLKLGGGVLNRFAGIVNNPQKGLHDRVKNYSKDRMAERRANANKLNAEALAAGGLTGRRNFARRRSATRFAQENYRKARKERDEEAAQNAWHQQTGRWGYNNNDPRDGDAFDNRDPNRGRFLRQPREGFGNLDTYKRDNALQHDAIEAHHGRHWQEQIESDQVRQALQRSTRMDQRIAKIVEEGMEKADDRAINTAINEDGKLSRYRETMVRATVNAGLSENAVKEINADGSATLAETILNSSKLKNQVIRTHEQQSRATQANELIEDAAKASWEKVTLDDRTVYTRQLERQANAKNLKALQAEWDSILTEASAGRTDDYQRRHGPITQQVSGQIDLIRQSEETIEVEEKRKANANYVVKSNLTKRLKSDGALLDRAAGIDEYGRTKVVAQLYKEGSALHMQNVEAVESTFSNEGYEATELIKVYQTGKLRNGEPATDMHIHAAIRQLASEKANNTAMQKMSDHIASQGMQLVNDQYFDVSDTARVNPLDKDEVDRRRDLQQIYADAMAKTGHSVTHLSGTDKAALQTGTYTAGTKTAILRDIHAGKIKADRVGKMDIDEMVRSLQIFRDNPTELDSIDVNNRQAYVDVIDEAMNDPIIGAKLETRHRRALEAMKLYLDPNTPRPTESQVNTTAGRRIPTGYDLQTMVD